MLIWVFNELDSSQMKGVIMTTAKKSSRKTVSQ